jgi:hypothetical protein
MHHDDHDPHAALHADLAAIVLADSGGEFGEGRQSFASGYDARGVIALAVVVGVLAVVIGWTAFSVRGEQRVAPAANSAPAVREEPAVPAALASEQQAADQALSPGVQLAPVRVRLVEDNAGGGIRIQGAVRNLGQESLIAGRSEYVVLLDGREIDRGVLTALDGEGGSVKIDEPYYGGCSAGVHSLLLYVDPSARVRESVETDNALTRAVTLRCGG